MTITITAFERSPDRGQGLARDMRVRWALEEVGLPYEARLLTMAAIKEAAHLAVHPFGQIPTYEEDGLCLFESGAIVLHIAAKQPGLLPPDGDARARAINWMFAALDTVEPPIVDREIAMIVECNESWHAARLPLLDTRIRARLDQLSAHIGDRDWLGDSFGAADLLMVTVLRRLNGSGLLTGYSALMAYVARGEARPAYQRAFAAQLAVFTGIQPTS